MKSKVLAISALLLVCCAGSVQAQTLEWKLNKGQTLSVETVNEMVTSMKLPDGSTQELPMKQQIDAQWRVQDSSKESFSVEQTVKRIRTSMKSPFMNVEYDSDQGDPKDPIGKQMASSMKIIIGAPIELKLGRRGNLIEMKLPDAIANQETSPSNPLSAETLKSSFQQQIEFPEGEIPVGKTWEQTLKTNMNGMQTKSLMKLRYDGVVEEQGRKLAKIHTDVVTELVQPPPGIEITMEDTGSDGDILFDVELGCLSKSLQRQRLKMNMSVGGQKLSQDIEGTTTTTYRLAN
jgi:hypothetical protein